MMLFQAYCFKYPVQSPNYNRSARFLLDSNVSLRIPCAPLRSSFAAALDDVRRVRELGFVADVLLVSNSNNNQ